jgi:hypothetical protein
MEVEGMGITGVMVQAVVVAVAMIVGRDKRMFQKRGRSI